MRNVKKTELIDTESRWWLPGDGGGGVWGRWGDVRQMAKTSSYKRNKFGELMYNLMTVVNNTVLSS